ncbi:MAG TPA: tetratricopeptide repeat protein [Kofleriaceae bacterium]|jgi:tetratricopeptide (TPR) repeat protein
MRRIAIAWLVLVALGGAAGAQPKPDDKAQAEARAHYLAARAHHEHGEYQRAAAEYLQAFALFPDPELLFNVGQVYRLAGDHELAAAYYRRYLELEPEGRAAPEARRHLDALGGTLPAGSTESKWGASPDSTEPAPAAAVAATPQRDTSPDDRRGRWLRLGGLAAGGTGLLFLGVGLYYGIEARSISAELSQVDRWTAERLDRFDDGERAEARAIGFSIAGGALLVGGGVLYWLGRRSQGRVVEVGAALGPAGEVAIAAGGRF